MRALLLATVCLATTLADPCRKDYEFKEGRCVRLVAEHQKSSLNYVLKSARSVCGNDNVPMIKSDEENEAINRIMKSYAQLQGNDLNLVLNLVCNTRTKKLEWYDGSPITYHPAKGSSLSFECVPHDPYIEYDMGYSRPRADDWMGVNGTIIGVYTSLCVEQPTEIPSTIPPERLTVCPRNYELMEGKCIKICDAYSLNELKYEISKCHQICYPDGATLPIIKSNEENEAFNTITRSLDALKGKKVHLGLDLVCNTSTKRLQWIDGTGIVWVPPKSSAMDFDCVAHLTAVDQAYSEPDTGAWHSVNSTDKDYYTMLCVVQPTEATTTTVTTTTSTTTTPRPTTTTKATTTTRFTTTVAPTTTTSTHKTSEKPSQQPYSEQCGDYSAMAHSSDSRSCYKVYTDSLSWNDAQARCSADFGALVTINNSEENKFFWSSAVSANLVNGIHIGAHQSPSLPSTWTWVDGEVPFDGKSYDNFISSFPIPGLGTCAAMMTDSTYDQWINEDCNYDPLPFICRRVDYTTLPKACPVDPPGAGQNIYPPGFPTSDTPCSYLLSVGANMLVELEVISLVAEQDHDFLEIHEGPVGSSMLANLTGTILSPVQYITSKSNVMRVNWKPNGSGEGRGYRIRYNEVTP